MLSEAFERAVEVASSNQLVCSFEFRGQLWIVPKRACSRVVIRTLNAWGAPADKAYFVGGHSKAPILKALAAHIFSTINNHAVKSFESREPKPGSFVENIAGV